MMKIIRKLITVLVLLMLVSGLAVCAHAAGQTGVSASGWTGLQEAFNSAGTDPDLPTVITLTDNVTAGEGDQALSLDSGKYVTLDLNGHSLSRGLTEAVDDGSVMEIRGQLTVRDNSSGQTGTITGGNSTKDGGGVYIDGGTFTLEGGSITGNSVNESGGGVVIDKGTFTMTGGSIIGNSALYGGGVYDYNGTFTMTGGSITGNSAVGSGDSNSLRFGGGVVIHDGAFRMTGGSIHGNSAYNGGGIYAYSGTFTMSGGSITGNSADNYGGGIYAFGGTLTMSGGSITGNSAGMNDGMDLDICGGGVYINPSGTYNPSKVTFNISGSPEIIGNVDDGTLDAGSGLYTGATRDNVFMNGKDAISDSDWFTITGALSDRANIGVNMDVAGFFTEGYSTYHGTTDPNRYFSSDCRYYNIELTDSGEVATVAQLHSITLDESTRGKVSVFGGQTSARVWSSVGLIVDPDVLSDLAYLYVEYTLDGQVKTDFAAPLIPLEDEEINEWAFRMPPADATVKAVFFSSMSTWAQLQTVLDLASMDPDNPTVIPLMSDITAAEGDQALSLDSDQYVILDLNGHTLSRGLTEAVDGGSVMEIRGDLTVRDSSDGQAGKITGGYSTEDGGGVLIKNGGTFRLEGGSITGNSVNEYGGGMLIDGGAFTMTGGSITRNSAASGGGIFFDSGTLKMTGGGITGNSAGYSGGGIFAYSGTLTMSGGSITGNSAGMNDGSDNDECGGGIYIYSYSQPTVTFNISGSPVITGNTDDGTWDAGSGLYTGSTRDNVFIWGESTFAGSNLFTLTGALTGGASIGVNMDKPNVFTQNYSSFHGTTDPKTFFSSDYRHYNIALTDNGEVATVSPLRTLTIDEPIQEIVSISDGQTGFHQNDYPTLIIDPAVFSDLAYVYVEYILDDQVETILPVLEYGKTDEWIFRMPPADATVKGVFFDGISTWEQLQNALNAASVNPDHPTSIKLAKDITATENDSYLTVKEGTYVTLNLNGHTLDGTGLPAIWMLLDEGNLTLKDSGTSGKIKSESYKLYIVEVGEDGTFSMESGTIEGVSYGVAGGGSISLSGGAIKSVDLIGTLTLSGAPVIENGIEIYTDAESEGIIKMGGKLETTVPIAIKIFGSKKTGVFTSGWKTWMSKADPADYFISADPDYIVQRNDSRECELVNIPVFGEPNFILPEGVGTVEADAFRNAAEVRIVDAQNCTSIGDGAFADTGIEQILVSKDCEISATAFDDMKRKTVYVFAEPGGKTQNESCAHNPYLIFVPYTVGADSQ